MTNLSLCSGYGGLDLAVEQITGNKTLVYAENDPFAGRVMEVRFPWATNLGDIKRIDWAALAQDHDFDTVSAGFPCQDISHAGLKKGITGARSGIWKNVFEAVRHTRPRLVFLENVDAIRSKDRGLDVVLADLASIGYDARWTCLRADEVKAPHRRWRWTCIAHPATSDPERSGRYRWPRHLAETQGRNEPADRGDQAAGAAGELALIPSPAVADSRGTRNWTAKRTPGKKFNSGKTLTDFAWLLSDEAWVSVDGIDWARRPPLGERARPSGTRTHRARNDRQPAHHTPVHGVAHGPRRGLGHRRRHTPRQAVDRARQRRHPAPGRRGLPPAPVCRPRSDGRVTGRRQPRAGP